jgi:NTP pyrophosphatase (non-canonical NTP hydrolase)
MVKRKVLKFADFDSYQKACKKTAVYPDIGKNFTYPTIGLMGEAGEVANKVKKLIRDDAGKISKERREEIKAEIGDMMWYIAQLSTELGLNLSKVAEYNLEKLAKRQKENKLHGSGDNR